MLIRPIHSDDEERFFELSRQASYGLTSLPDDRDLLNRRIYKSQRSFDYNTDRPGDESYLFVLESDTGEIIGSTGIKAKVGGFEPFYSYRLETVLHESKTLNIRREVRALLLVAEHNGPTEIGSLFLSPDWRGGGGGRFLSLARFLFIAQHPRRFESEVIAEMRGLSDDEGRSPFWDGLGRHFFEMEFPLADYMSMRNKHFIAELMPAHPVYLDLLSVEARESIGRVHPKTMPALKILEREGFRYEDLVDIFDAGPLIRCPTHEIRSVRESFQTEVEKVAVREEIGDALYYIGNTSLADFRVVPGFAAHTPEGGVVIDSEAASLLGVRPGDRVRFVEARPPRVGVRNSPDRSDGSAGPEGTDYDE